MEGSISAAVPGSGHPYGPPSVSGADITVDYALNNPEMIMNTILELTYKKFLSEVFFTPGGEISGGALIYTEVSADQTYAERDVERVNPGAEFPLITFERPEPQIALVQKYGGRFEVTDEARRRNKTEDMQMKITQLRNTIIRKQNALAMSIVNDKVTTGQTFNGNNWTPVDTKEHPEFGALGDIAKANAIAENKELGVVFDTLVCNATDYGNLVVSLSPRGGIPANDLLSALGITEVFTSPRVTAGTAWLCQRGGLGSMRMEVPLTVTTWREEARQVTHVLAFMLPLFAAMNPYAILKMESVNA